MNRDAEITRTIDWCLDGLLTVREAIARLEEFQVRGGFNRLSYTGYDYAAQQWVERGVS